MKIKKAILTGGGRATRLRPITNTINKHLIPLANKPMIYYAIEKAVAAGVQEIFINVNPEETQLQRQVGDGGHWGVSIKFFVQTGGPRGIAHVVKCAEKFIGSDSFMFYLSDNMILGSLQPFFDQFVSEKADAMFAFAAVPDPERFGVPVFNSEKKLIDVIEKPPLPACNLAQTGIYLYGPKLFFKAFDNIEPSERGEYEISSINSYLIKNNYRISHREITGWWKDTGKPNDLLVANSLLLSERAPETYKTEGTIAPGATLAGPVQIGLGTTVNANSKIIGPAMIAANCTLENCTIGPNVTVAPGCTLRDCTLANSIILSSTTIDSRVSLTDSIIGEAVNITSAPSGVAESYILGDHTTLKI
ncbi:MAG: sugar phosphate nucleotidyltransferase [Candidatus Magasanikbacteria bacterium]|nr:sugar phosphate nucleotidyltransferase [Candidatus Magasanikbacteria bacterium]